MQGLVGGLKTLARGATVTVGGVGKAGGAGGVGKAGGAGGLRQLFSKPPSGTQGRLPTDVREKNKTTLVSSICTLYSCYTKTLAPDIFNISWCDNCRSFLCSCAPIQV